MADGQFTEAEVRNLVGERNWRSLKDSLSASSVQDTAELLGSVSEADMLIIFRLLPKQHAADVFSELEVERQVHLLQQMTSEHARAILSELPPDDRTELFEELPGEVMQKLLNLLPPEVRRETLQLLGYPEDSVGRLMTPEYIAVRSRWDVEKALAHVRKYGHYAETVDVVYAVDERWHLSGYINLSSLLFADPKQSVEAVVERQCISVSALADREKAVKAIEKYDLVVLPVVDSENVLVGIVTVDDVIDVIEEEVTEDIHMSASIVPLDVGYSVAPFWLLYRKRVLWLSILVVLGFISTSIIAAFEDSLAAIVALAFFIPMLLGSGGNTGSQSATLVIRAMATGDLTLDKWLMIIKKELIVGFMLGATLGAFIYAAGFLLLGDANLGFVVGLSMFAIVLWANLVGSLLPLFLTRFDLDPAVVGTPFIATLIDVAGLLIYFMIAKWWLNF
ncbi:MAG: magnesium transporter [Candidatus Altiarchaeota archaeon]|nr:magnesium transporter [Candidatus Altiarchaeota archaeon]